MILCYACRQEPRITLLRGFIQQRMETDVHTHSQTSGGIWGLFGRVGGRTLNSKEDSVIEGSGTPQENLKNQQTWAHEGTQRLNHQSKCMHGLHIDPLPICSRYADCSSCGFPKNWSEDCFTLCCLHLDSFLRFACLVSVGEELKSVFLFRVIGPATVYYIYIHY